MNFRQKLERMAEIFSGIAIFSVDKGSTTHRAGVRAGDVLVAVNGRRVHKLAEYASARKLRDDILELVVIRDGREMRLWAGCVPANQQTETAPAEVPIVSDQGLTCPWRGAA